MTLRVRGCRGSQPCPSEPARLPSSSFHTPRPAPPSESFLTVAAASYTGMTHLPLPCPQPCPPPWSQPAPAPAPPSRPSPCSAGPVLPSSHLLDQVASKTPHAHVSITSPPGTPGGLGIPPDELTLSSRSLLDGGRHAGHDSHKDASTRSWLRKGKQWSLPRVPKRPGRFSSRRNRCNTTASTVSALRPSRPARPASSHPDFREFHF